MMDGAVSRSIARTVGSAALIIAAVQYVVAEAVTASAWANPQYSYSNNFISDLGVPSCGGVLQGRTICSPLYAVMNIGFVVQGVLFVVAAVLLFRLLPGRWACGARDGICLPRPRRPEPPDNLTGRRAASTRLLETSEERSACGDSFDLKQDAGLGEASDTDRGTGRLDAFPGQSVGDAAEVLHELVLVGGRVAQLRDVGELVARRADPLDLVEVAVDLGGHVPEIDVGLAVGGGRRTRADDAGDDRCACDDHDADGEQPVARMPSTRTANSQAGSSVSLTQAWLVPR